MPRVINLSAVLTLDSEQFNSGVKKVNNGLKDIKRNFREGQTALDAFSKQFTQRFVSMAAGISLSTRALRTFISEMQRGERAGAKGARLQPWDQPDAGGGGWLNFAKGLAIDAAGIAIGIGVTKGAGRLWGAGKGFFSGAKGVIGGGAAGAAVSRGIQGPPRISPMMVPAEPVEVLAPEKMEKALRDAQRLNSKVTKAGFFGASSEMLGLFGGTAAGTAAGTLAGGKIGAGLGIFAGPAGAAVGGLLGGAVGGALGYLGGKGWGQAKDAFGAMMPGTPYLDEVERWKAQIPHLDAIIARKREMRELNARLADAITGTTDASRAFTLQTAGERREIVQLEQSLEDMANLRGRLNAVLGTMTTPVERLAADMATLNEALEAGMMTAAEHRDAGRRLRNRGGRGVEITPTTVRGGDGPITRGEVYLRDIRDAIVNDGVPARIGN